MELHEFLSLLVSGGAGAVVFWLMENVPALKGLRPDHKRYVSLLLAVLLPVAAWLGMVALGYQAAPGTWQGWIERVFVLATGSLVVSQGVHGAMVLRDRG
jgi:hypothetical protein